LRAGLLALLLPALASAASQDRVSDETVRILRGPLANKARVQLDHFPVDGIPRRLDLERFEADRRSEAVAERVSRDFRAGVRAGCTGAAGDARTSIEPSWRNAMLPSTAS